MSYQPSTSLMKRSDANAQDREDGGNPVPSPTKSSSGLSLKGRALRYLAMRDYSRAELVSKLTPYAQDSAEVARTIDELAAKGLQSDERTANAVARVGAARYGNARIKAKLQHKGVDAHQIQAALEALEDSELSRARAVWQRKFGEQTDEPKEKARQIRFLVGRGFSQSVVYRVIRGAEEE